MKRLSPVILAVVVASCATKPPEQQPLERVEVPPEWDSEFTAGVPDDRWWEDFGSSNLNSVVEEALTNNNDIRVAVARLDAAVAQSGIEGSAQYPWLGFNFDAGDAANGRAGDAVRAFRNECRSRVMGLGLRFRLYRKCFAAADSGR